MKLKQSRTISVHDEYCSGIQTGEETQMNALLRTTHLKEIPHMHTNVHFKWTNTPPYGCQNIRFLS